MARVMIRRDRLLTLHKLLNKRNEVNGCGRLSRRARENGLNQKSLAPIDELACFRYRKAG